MMELCVYVGMIWSSNSLSHMQSVFYNVYNIRRIRKFLSFKAAKTLIQALVISHLDYCNSVLYGIPAIQTNELQRVQNAAARLLTNTPRY